MDGARAYLPRLRHLLSVLRRAGLLAVTARHNGHGGVRARSAPPAPAVGPPVDAAEAQAELEAGGIIVRDLGRGLVDFPARHRGRTVLLCWVEGEEDLGWWHEPEAGFAGRRRLPLPPGDDAPGG